MKDAPTTAGFELLLPAGRDATLDDCRKRLGPKEFLEVSVLDGEAIVRGHVVDVETQNLVPVAIGKLTAVRNWFWAVAKGGAEFHFVARENGRPHNAWRINVTAERVEVERLAIRQFDEVISRDEYLSIAKR